MEHGTVRKLMRAATLSLLMLATTAGVASLDVMAASPAMAEPDPSAPAPGNEPKPPASPIDGVTKAVSGALGGQNAPTP